MKDILQDIGFDEKEAEIYLTLLAVGKGKVTDILAKTHIERRTIYDILERLIQKGHVSYIEENRTRIFTPTAPHLIKAQLEERTAAFSKIIPQLNSLQQQKENTRIELLKGKQGIKTIFTEIIETKKTHYAFGDVSKFIDLLSTDTQQFLNKLNTQQGKEKIIYAQGKQITKIQQGEYRTLPKELVPPTPTIIYGNVVVMFIFSTPITIIKITSEEVAKTNMQYFNTFWKMAKKA